MTSPPHEILYLLSEVFNTVVDPLDKTHDTVGEPYDKTHDAGDYADYLKVLEWKLRSINTTSQRKQAPTDTIIELYRLATLIYLRRASASVLQMDKRFIEWIKQAFTLLNQLPECQCPLPLLIFGCEAETDEQRIIILDLISRTKKTALVPNLKTVERTIQTIWVQEDLHGDLDYVRKLGIILSTTHSTVPAFF